MKVEFSVDILENVFVDDVVEIYNCFPPKDKVLILESILGKCPQKETIDLIEDILLYKRQDERKKILEKILEKI